MTVQVIYHDGDRRQYIGYFKTREGEVGICYKQGGIRIFDLGGYQLRYESIRLGSI